MVDVTSAARCVAIRELSRSTGELIDEVERDGKAFVVSRRGRMVALLVPLPEHVIIEFEERAPVTSAGRRQPEADVDLDALDLSELACEFLIDAASTPTGYWHAPGSAFLADQGGFFRTLRDLDAKGLTDFVSASGRRITKEGRAVAKALREAGRRGYEEVHDGGGVSSVEDHGGRAP